MGNKFGEQGLHESILGFIGETVRGKRLVGKTMMNHQLFVKVFSTIKLLRYTISSTMLLCD